MKVFSILDFILVPYVKVKKMLLLCEFINWERNEALLFNETKDLHAVLSDKIQPAPLILLLSRIENWIQSQTIPLEFEPFANLQL